MRPPTRAAGPPAPPSPVAAPASPHTPRSVRPKSAAPRWRHTAAARRLRTPRDPPAAASFALPWAAAHVPAATSDTPVAATGGSGRPATPRPKDRRPEKSRRRSRLPDYPYTAGHRNRSDTAHAECARPGCPPALRRRQSSRAPAPRAAPVPPARAAAPAPAARADAAPPNRSAARPTFQPPAPSRAGSSLPLPRPVPSRPSRLPSPHQPAVRLLRARSPAYTIPPCRLKSSHSREYSIALATDYPTIAV